MKRHPPPSLLIAVGLTMFIVSVSLAAAPAKTNRMLPTAGPQNRPNLLFILTDDQRWNTLSCMGDTDIVTPNLDRLAHEGVLFQNHFVTTSIYCCSRASILTGQYLRRHNVHDFKTPLTTAQWAETYPALLR